MMRNPEELRSAKAAAKAAWGHLDGVNGFGIGDDVVHVYLRNDEAGKALPDDINGVPLKRVIVGDVEPAEAE